MKSWINRATNWYQSVFNRLPAASPVATSRRVNTQVQPMLSNDDYDVYLPFSGLFRTQTGNLALMPTTEDESAYLPSEQLDTGSLPVVNLTPPKLDDNYLGQQIDCYRPMRDGSPNMSIEFIGDQVIAHNYGHGGSGWTIGPGCADYVIKQMQAEKKINFKHDSKISVIGAGVIGLMTAYYLLKEGYYNIEIIAADFEHLASHNAGGLLAPVSMNNDPKGQELVEKMCVNSYRFYQQIVDKRNDDFNKLPKTGVKVVPVYFQNKQEAALESLVDAKLMKPSRDVIVDFGNGAQYKMVEFLDGIFIDTYEVMYSLHLILEEKNIKFTKKQLQSFGEVDSTFIFNCAGMGAQELNNDKNMRSVQGHLCMLKQQTPLDYMILIYLGEDENNLGQKRKKSVYYMPKSSGVIGGTFIEDADSQTPNEEEFDQLISNARLFFGRS